MLQYVHQQVANFVCLLLAAEQVETRLMSLIGFQACNLGENNELKEAKTLCGAGWVCHYKQPLSHYM